MPVVSHVMAFSPVGNPAHTSSKLFRGPTAALQAFRSIGTTDTKDAGPRKHCRPGRDTACKSIAQADLRHTKEIVHRLTESVTEINAKIHVSEQALIRRAAVVRGRACPHVTKLALIILLEQQRKLREKDSVQKAPRSRCP